MPGACRTWPPGRWRSHPSAGSRRKCAGELQICRSDWSRRSTWPRRAMPVLAAIRASVSAVAASYSAACSRAQLHVAVADHFVRQLRRDVRVGLAAAHEERGNQPASRRAASLSASRSAARPYRSPECGPVSRTARDSSSPGSPTVPTASSRPGVPVTAIRAPCRQRPERPGRRRSVLDALGLVGHDDAPADFRQPAGCGAGSVRGDDDLPRGEPAELIGCRRDSGAPGRRREPRELPLPVGEQRCRAHHQCRSGPPGADGTRSPSASCPAPCRPRAARRSRAPSSARARTGPALITAQGSRAARRGYRPAAGPSRFTQRPATRLASRPPPAHATSCPSTVICPVRAALSAWGPVSSPRRGARARRPVSGSISTHRPRSRATPSAAATAFRLGFGERFAVQGQLPGQVGDTAE